ncbi:hypothetical protein DVK02_14990 [Halobellus sp. Atlit-31R]|nr:hypothetical protein DVK02_14990 [Halobellus sp. Atlit-31R]
MVAAVLLLASSAVGAAETWTTGPAGATYETDSGLRVTPTVDHGAPQDPFNGSDTLVLSDATFTASGSASLDVDQINGSRTELSAIDAASNPITIDPDDKSEISVSGSVTALSFSDATIDGTTQFTYSADGSGSITVTGLAPDTDFAAATTGGDVLETGTTDADGTATISVDAATDEDVVLLEPTAPVVDASSATPTDGAQVTARSINFSIDVSDGDFATAAGDELDATFYLDGDAIANNTLTADGTTTASAEIPVGGPHEWSVEVTDAYGRTTTSETFTFDVPARLEIMNESAPSERIQSDGSAEVTFFSEDGDTVITRPVENGTVDFAGIPTDQEFIAQIDAAGYSPRRVVIPSLIEQQTAYFLPESASSAQIVFTLNDDTGRFTPESTRLYVEKPISVNNSTEFRIVTADTFGASGEFTTVLEDDSRYRLRVVNEEGETRTLGSYTTSGDAFAELPIGQVQISSDVGSGGVAFNAALQEVETEEGTQRVIKIVYRDPSEATDELTLSVVNATSGEELRPETTETGPYGRYIETIPLPAGAPEDVSYEVTWSAERNGDTLGTTVEVGEIGPTIDGVEVDGRIQGLIGYLTILGFTSLTVIRSPRLAPIVAVATAVAVTTIGVVTIPPSAIGIGGAIAVMAFIGGGDPLYG